MNYCRSIISHNLNLPSQEEASRFSLCSYFETTLMKIRSYHRDIRTRALQQQKREQKNYSSLTNEQITERGYFLHYIYECILSLHSISKHWTFTTPNQSNKTNNESSFKVFLNDLLCNIDDLAKITRIKRTEKEQSSPSLELNRQIMEMFHQTEIYAYQILLRIFQIKFVYEQHEKYLKELEEIHQKYIFREYFTQQKKLLSSKREKATMKRLFHEIQTILRYYHCEVTINRSQCKSKPQINCLVHLLKSKLSRQLLEYIKEHCDFRCEGELIVAYSISQKAIVEDEPVVNVKSQEPVQIQEEVCKVQIENALEGPQLQSKSHHSQSKENQKHSKKQSASAQQKQSQEIVLVLKHQNEQQVLLQASKQERKPTNHAKYKQPKEQKRESEEGSKGSQDYVQSNLLDLKYERKDIFSSKHLHEKGKHSKHHFSKTQSFKQKMKAFGHNQRFTNTSCNFKYVLTSKNHKKKYDKKEEKVQKHFKESDLLNTPIPITDKLEENSQDSCLAEQTPVHRKRTYIPPYQSKN